MRRSASVLLILLAAACDARVADWCSSDDGVSTMVVTHPTGWGVPPEFDLAWRIEGSYEGAELVLPSSVTISTTLGMVAMVDFALGEVLILDLEGDWVRRWGTRGDGPGEIRGPVAAAWRDDELLVYDVPNSKVVTFDSTGGVTGQMPVHPAVSASLLNSGIFWINLGADGSLIARQGAVRASAEGLLPQIVVRASLEGPMIDTLLRVSVPMVQMPGSVQTLPAPDWSLPLAAVSPEGALALAGEVPHYRIELSQSDRTTRICRDVPALPAVDRALDIDPSIPVELVAAMEAAPKPDEQARIGRLQFDAQNRLWVQRDRPRGLSMEDETIGREAALFDVYGPESEYLGEVQMPPRTRFLGATDQLIIGLERDDLDVFSFVGYRPRW